MDLWDEPTLIFGSHKGKALRSVDSGYLEWMLKTLDGLSPDERRAVQSELLDRTLRTHNRRAYSPPPPRPPMPPALPPGVTPDVILQLVSAGKQTLAKRLHPDAGGDPEAMKRVNLAADFLTQQARSLTPRNGGARA